MQAGTRAYSDLCFLFLLYYIPTYATLGRGADYTPGHYTGNRSPSPLLTTRGLIMGDLGGSPTSFLFPLFYTPV